MTGRYKKDPTKSGFNEVEKFINLAGEVIDTSLLVPEGDCKGKILLLHGAGESTKDRMLPLARELAKLGWSCLTFSLIGHGKSSGALLGSTLQGRKKLSRKIAKEFDFWPPDIVVAISMGGHTAISLLGDEPDVFSKLVLLVPAIYAREAEDVAFGPEFSKILRTDRSYLSSLSWEILLNYHGDLATVSASEDKVIPPDIYNLIGANAIHTNRQQVVIKGIGHELSSWTVKEPERLVDFARAIDSFDCSNLDKYGSHETNKAL